MPRVYLCGRRWFPRYAVVATLLLGMAFAAAGGLLHLDHVTLRPATPIFTMPTLSAAAVATGGVCAAAPAALARSARASAAAPPMPRSGGRARWWYRAASGG